MPHELWLGYAGTLGTSYDLPLVFDALRKVDKPNIRFVVMGDGPLMDKFQEQSKDLNVIFTGRINYNQMCGALYACDMVVNPIVGLSVASIINKHADYAASGKPIINTQKNKEYQDLIIQYKMGANCDTVFDVCKAILNLIEDDALREKQGLAAKKCAIELFDRGQTYAKLSDAIYGRVGL